MTFIFLAALFHLPGTRFPFIFDIKQLNFLWNFIGLHPAVIAGVASRESNFGFSLTPDGWGDHHNAYGMMQVS